MARQNNFDALRLLAAVSVIFSHAFLIAEGTQDHEPLILLTGRQAILGLAGVFVFFAISGFLVTKSFEETRSPLRYLVKRSLRIFPGLFAALIFAAFILAPCVLLWPLSRYTLPLGEYLRRPEPWRYVLGNLALSTRVHELPGVMFVKNPVGLEVNGALWTLRYEFLMYLLVMVLGTLRLIRLPVCLGLVALGMACIGTSSLGFLGGWGWLLGFFAAGMALYKLRDTWVFSGKVALIAFVGLVLSVPLHQFILLFPVFGCYLALWLALEKRLPVLPAARFGDLSYGLYIYGWPAEQAVVWAFRGEAAWWQVFLLALPLATALAFLSWHLVERPALRLKPRPPLPRPAHLPTTQRV